MNRKTMNLQTSRQKITSSYFHTGRVLFRNLVNRFFRFSIHLYILLSLLYSNTICRFLFFSFLSFLWLKLNSDLFSIKEAYAMDNLPNLPPQAPEQSETGSNCPYSGMPPRVSRQEENISAEWSEAPGAKAVHENPEEGDEGTSSSRRKGGARCSPLEPLLKESEEVVRIQHWLQHEASEEARTAYQAEARRREEERTRSEDAKREARRQYDAKRYKEKKEMNGGN